MSVANDNERLMAEDIWTEETRRAARKAKLVTLLNIALGWQMSERSRASVAIKEAIELAGKL